MNGSKIAITAQNACQPSPKTIAHKDRSENVKFTFPLVEVFMGLIVLVAILGALALLWISFSQKLVITDCPHIHTNTTYLGYPSSDHLPYGKQVVAELTQAIERVPNCATLYWSLGDVQDWLGERTEALQSYRRYVQLAGDQAEPAVVKVIQRLEGDLIENPLAQQATP